MLELDLNLQQQNSSFYLEPSTALDLAVVQIAAESAAEYSII